VNIALFVSVLGFLLIATFVLIFENHRFAPVLAVTTVLYVRGIRHLGPDVQTHTDSFYYFMASRALLETRHLNAPTAFVDVYDFVDNLLNLTLYPAITAAIGVVGTSGDLELLRLLVPILFGPLLFGVVWMVYRHHLPEQWALSGAFTYAMLDIAIGHHVIYHQQAIGTVSLLFFLALLLLPLPSGRLRYVVVPFAFVLPLSHKYTPYLALLLAGGLAATYFAVDRISDDPDGYFGPVLRRRSRTIVLYGLVLVAMGLFVTRGLFNDLVYSVGLISQKSFQLSDLFGQMLTSGPSSQYSISTRPTLIDRGPLVTKLLLALLCVAGLWTAFRRREKVVLVPVVLGVLTVVGLLVAIPLLGLALIGRVMIIGYFIGILVAAYGLANSSPRLRRSPAVKTVATLVVVALLVTNVLVAVHPSRIDPTADISNDGYTDVEPVGTELQSAGYWINQYVPKSDSVYAPESPRGAVFYHGLHKRDFLSTATRPGYALNDEARYPGLTQRANRYYTNGRLTVAYGDADEINPRFS